MPNHDRPDSDPLAAIAKVAVGIGVVAVAAAKAFGSKGPPARRRRSTIAQKIAEATRAGARGNPEPRRKPPEAGIAVPAVPPNGPLPKTGGAEAPLEFD